MSNNIKGISCIWGISESRSAPVAAYLSKEENRQSLIVTSSAIRARRLALDLSFFADKKIYVLPEEDGFIRYQAKNHDELLERMKILKVLRSGEACIIIAPVTGAVKKLPPRNTFEENALKLSIGEELDPEEVKRKLALMGYERTSIVEARGEFSARGGIIDVFTAHMEEPVRIEFFDTEIDGLRTFDLDTQRSLEVLNSIDIYPAEQLLNLDNAFDKAAQSLGKEYDAYIRKQRKAAEAKFGGMADESGEGVIAFQKLEQLEKRKNELQEYIKNVNNVQLLENYIHYFHEETQYIWDYMKEESLIMVDDPDRVYETIEARTKELKEDFKVLLERGHLVPKDFSALSGTEDFLKIYDLAEQNKIYVFAPFQKQPKGILKLDSTYSLSSRQPTVFNGRMEAFQSELTKYVKEDYDITIVCSTDERVENLREFTARCDLSGKVKFAKGSLTSGIDFPEHKICYLWDGDIFAAQKQGARKKKQSKGKPIQTFSDMKKGDYVVHENHGIGKFTGIEQLIVQGIKKDYLKIKYGGEDLLYVPVEQMDLIQKYVGADGATPKINKLSGGEWKKTKAKVKAAIANMAKELLELSAARKLEKGYSFSEDSVWQTEFEETFPFEETDDQLRSIKEIKADMEKPEVMDRLLCGDVGYGKTEVAARALFKCVADGKQGAVLVPTTILANQHYYTLKERFEKFPFKVEMLCRFRSEKQQDAIIDKLGNGSIDLVIGTHRMLSKDMQFKDLGLLVIDEEQRFGVQHKEKIKMIRKNVDVLTMSATPIPRTLHMSLVGIKDMSLIEEPPHERYPVQTYVLEQEEELIREAVERELERGGQVYVVYNRVAGIQKIASMISRLVPESKVAVGHGQMNERQLEDIMIGFINNESNVLVATTIIESGIDIPNANTMIVLDADKMGLSQLYQLRGRVGRSNKIAYAYLMYQKDKVLTEVSEKRLRAIKEFTEFGAGFKIAMRDLEIRGAGNLLGTEQHGHMMMIGYELYCKLIDDAVRALGGEVVNPDREESSIELQVTAFIPDIYIPDEILKLQMYKKIASIETAEHEEEILDELIDRFGEITFETMNLIKISRIRSMAEKLCITRIHEEIGKVIFDFAKGNPLKAEKLGALIGKYGTAVFIHGGVKPFIRFSVKGKNKLDEVIEILESIK